MRNTRHDIIQLFGIRDAFLDFYNQSGIKRSVRVGVFNLERDVIAGERLPITRPPFRCCHQRGENVDTMIKTGFLIRVLL